MEFLESMISTLVVGWVGQIENSGYLGIFILMAIESSFIPLPSEVVMIPAGVLVAQGKLSMTGCILAGTFGSLAGALFNYFFALWLGRAFLLRYGKYFFLPASKMEWVERHWQKHGEMATFVCRLLPVLRHLISLPAGLARMNLPRFCLWTTVGAALWVAILTYTGYFLGERAELLWKEHKTLLTLGLFALGGAAFALYALKIFLHRGNRTGSPAISGAEPSPTV